MFTAASAGFRYLRSSALQDIADSSVENFNKNRGFLKQMPVVKQKSYLGHLEFLNPGVDDRRVADIAKVSNQNINNFIDIVAKVPISSGWQSDEEDVLLKRVNDLQFVLRHGSASPELILDSGSIYSRSVISGEVEAVPGLMKKPGDEQYRYKDFVFFHLNAAPSNHEVVAETGSFKFLFDDSLLQEGCMFLRDCFSNMPKRIVGEKSLHLGRPLKSSFSGTICYIETDHGKFRWRAFDESQKEICATDFITNRQQFFFGEDVKSAIFLSTVLYSRIFGRDYLLALSDEDFSKKASEVLGFEIRIPNNVSLENAFHCYAKPSESMSPIERKRMAKERKKDIDSYSGIVFD